MGSTASALNSLASTTVVDIYKRTIKPQASDQNYLNASRLATVFWGLVCLTMALYAGQLGNLLEAVNKLGSYLYGVILGIFVVAFYLKNIKANAVFIAALMAELIVVFIGWQEWVAYLWLNAVGCFGVVIIASIINYCSSMRLNKSVSHE
jgi:Na+/proline symporter